MPCWLTSGRVSSYGRQPGAGETLKQVAEWPQQILQRPQILVRPEPVTFSPFHLRLPPGSLLRPEDLWGPLHTLLWRCLGVEGRIVKTQLTQL